MAGEPTLTLVGNITANPEQRGDTVTFTIAHNTRRRDRNGQTVDGDAVFMRCAASRPNTSCIGMIDMAATEDDATRIKSQ